MFSDARARVKKKHTPLGWRLESLGQGKKGVDLSGQLGQPARSRSARVLHRSRLSPSRLCWWSSKTATWPLKGPATLSSPNWKIPYGDRASAVDLSRTLTPNPRRSTRSGIKGEEPRRWMPRRCDLTTQAFDLCCPPNQSPMPPGACLFLYSGRQRPAESITIGKGGSFFNFGEPSIFTFSPAPCPHRRGPQR